MNGEYEQCNDCGHVWEHEDDRCPDCGSQDTEEFDVKVRLKENWQQIKELRIDYDVVSGALKLAQIEIKELKETERKLQEIILNKH